MDSIPVTKDFQLDPKNVLGYIYAGHDLVKMMQEGYIFEVAPEIECDGVDENGFYINPRLLSVSIISGTARKMEDDNGIRH